MHRQSRMFPRAAAALICAALLLLAGCAAEAPAAAPAAATPAPVATLISTPAASAAAPTPTATAAPETDAQKAADLVTAFGKVLQNVSLLDKGDVAQSMEKNYKRFVTPALLKSFQASPKKAPGRSVSSPWPDRIDIFGVQQDSDDEYTVSGQIVEITSADLKNAAARRAITLTVAKQADGAFLISGAALGDYAQKGPVVYENTEFGFDFYLPAGWKGYTVLEDQWEGTPFSGEGEKQYGRELFIRHPKWTEADPRQDIPIMVFTPEQWDAVTGISGGEGLAVSAAPVPPSMLGRNARYVFALPARYNFAFPTGFEEVEQIIAGSPLWPVD